MNGPELLESVLDFLDTLIAEHGHILYMVLVYVSLPLIVWIQSGGLRRRLTHQGTPRKFSLLRQRDNTGQPFIIVGGQREWRNTSAGTCRLPLLAAGRCRRF